MADAAEKLEPQNALVNLEKLDIPAIFGEGKTADVLEYIRKQVVDIVPDMSTAKGRSEIKSAAYQIARSKTLLDDAGKNYAADLKARVKKIDANRRTVRDELDKLRDDVRRPVTEWEEAEAKRAQAIADRINKLVVAGQTQGTSSSEIAETLDAVKATDITEEVFGEKAGEAALAKDVAVTNLERALKSAKQREADQAELDRLRKEDEERQAKEDEQARIREAEERAQRKAEQEAQEQLAAEQRAREEADRRAREAEDRAAKAAEEAQAKIEADRKAREDEARREQEEEAKRRADREHRQNVNNAAIAAICEWSELTEDQAGEVVALIAGGHVPAVTIRY